jgi:hypothetical protein
MKTKTFNKRLTLNKSTVAHLDNSVMAYVRGGDPVTLDTCDTCNGTTCIVTLCNDNTCVTCDGNTCVVSCPTGWKEYTCWGPGCVE